MNANLGTAPLDRFRVLVARHLGLRFDDSRRSQLAEAFGRRLKASEESAEAYVARLCAQGMPREEVRALADELTVPESYFFRHLDQLRAFMEVALPDRMRARGGLRRLRLLSAGCASGEEAYSLAILTRDLAAAGWDVSIRGIDVSRNRIERAVRGRYSAWSLRETPPDVLSRHFRADGKDFAVDPALKAMVTFEERNLVDEDAALWERDVFDVVFCRNVIMYLTPEAARGLAARITRSLAPGGFLFLGHAETLRGLSHDYHLRHTHGTFYYQLRDAADRPMQTPTPIASAASPGQPYAARSPDESWVDAILHSSHRVRTLTEPRTDPSEPSPSDRDGPAPRWDLSVALDHLRHERFGAARRVLGDLPPDSARDPDVLLLKAVLLTQEGDLGAAEEVIRGLLTLDELNAGAQYVLALCREGMGDHAAASEHDHVAAYLDASFAMPRLHLGLLARRAGNLDGARRELEQALPLLEREEASRLLLFGGGFSRDALVALCRAQIASCGDAG